MRAIKKYRPGYGRSAHTNTAAAATATVTPEANHETTLGTLEITQLYDTNIQNRFHRLMLISADGDVAGTYPLNRKHTHIGRSRSNTIRIKDPHASVKHLTVNISDGVCVAKDRNSTNGTLINGERLDDFHVLKDGDEIMVGKTIFQYASRDAHCPEHVEPAPDDIAPQSALKKPFFLSQIKFHRAAACFLLLTLTTGLIFCSTIVFGHLRKSKLPQRAAVVADNSTSATRDSAVTTQTADRAANENFSRLNPKPNVPIAHIQQALDKYTAGQIDSAMQSLNALSNTGGHTQVALKAEKILMKLRLVKEIYTQALQAQDQEDFSLALDRWDGLLQVDRELVGDRPSYFAVQAGLNVQTLSYKRALKAFHAKNHVKAKQLCQMILRIDAKNMDALNLLTQIDAQT